MEPTLHQFRRTIYSKLNKIRIEEDTIVLYQNAIDKIPEDEIIINQNDQGKIRLNIHDIEEISICEYDAKSAGKTVECNLIDKNGKKLVISSLLAWKYPCISNHYWLVYKIIDDIRIKKPTIKLSFYRPLANLIAGLCLLVISITVFVTTVTDLITNNQSKLFYNSLIALLILLPITHYFLKKPSFKTIPYLRKRC